MLMNQLDQQSLFVIAWCLLRGVSCDLCDLPLSLCTLVYYNKFNYTTLCQDVSPRGGLFSVPQFIIWGTIDVVGCAIKYTQIIITE
uniref:Putative secreted protein n=1 Tax=Lutzomyia longipalpis TaxID=7200 RepID=A0A7G3AGU9_LUTLO